MAHQATKESVMDRAGFDVKNLAECCKRLPQQNITFAQPLHCSKELGNIQAAVLIDPWGTVIELTGGCGR
jgi:hypothetical protein